MITKEKIDIFLTYNGDRDKFSVIGNSYAKGIITDNDWTTLDNLVQDLILVERKLVSEEYKKKVIEILNNNVESSAREYLRSIILRKQ